MHKEDSPILKGIIRPTLIGVLLGAIGCLLTLLILAAASASFDIPAATTLPLATVATAVGALIGGFSAAKISGKNGWMLGALSSATLFLVSMISGIGIFSHLDSGFILIKAAVMLVCGIVGGIFAVNSGSKHKR